MDECSEVFDDDDDENIDFKVVDIANHQSSIYFDNATLNDDIDIFDMTSLSNLLLLEQSRCKPPYESNDSLQNDDMNLNRLSLAYERLHCMPKLLLQELAPSVKILDISNNEFTSLDFLKEFKELTSLICDHNNITSNTSIPYLPKLELLWMNHCKLTDMYPWIQMLRCSCPNLKYLSLMGNPMAPCYLTGGNFYEFLQYRFSIISAFPNLQHLDDRIVTPEQRHEAQKMYHRPILDRFVTETQKKLPNYLRTMSEKFTGILATNARTGVKIRKRNAIV